MESIQQQGNLECLRLCKRTYRIMAHAGRRRRGGVGANICLTAVNSGLKMLDYPSLASKEVVEVRKRLGLYGEHWVWAELLPDWLVLRPPEIQDEKLIDTGNLDKFYELVQTFDATEKINAVFWLPVRAYLQYDQTFLIFHRKPDASLKPPG